VRISVWWPHSGEIKIRKTIDWLVGPAGLGNLTFPLIRRFVDAVELVSEVEVARAVLIAAEEMKMIVEPGGAVGLVAAARAAHTHPGQHVAILGGGNMPLERLEQMRVLAAQ
jgi:threonine dehydratase